MIPIFGARSRSISSKRGQQYRKSRSVKGRSKSRERQVSRPGNNRKKSLPRSSGRRSSTRRTSLRERVGKIQHQQQTHVQMPGIAQPLNVQMVPEKTVSKRPSSFLSREIDADVHGSGTVNSPSQNVISQQVPEKSRRDYANFLLSSINSKIISKSQAKSMAAVADGMLNIPIPFGGGDDAEKELLNMDKIRSTTHQNTPEVNSITTMLQAIQVDTSEAVEDFISRITSSTDLVGEAEAIGMQLKATLAKNVNEKIEDVLDLITT